MKPWAPILLVALGVAGFLFWDLRRHQSTLPTEVLAHTRQDGSRIQADRRHRDPEAKALETQPEPSTEQASTVTAPAFKAAPAVTSHVEPLAPELASIAPATVLENMRTTIRQYGAMFGGNPVGSNSEITEALQGENPKHINFLKADGNRINSQGELVDGWGTPYFFHQLSRTETEIRSAGPDRIMYTADDLMIK